MEFEKNKKIHLESAVEYADGAVVSKVIIKNSAGNLTLFAFDENQELSEHTAPFDAMVQVLDGEAEVIIEEQSSFLKKGDVIIMPANVPHAVKAFKKFKMLLTMIKGTYIE